MSRTNFQELLDAGSHFGHLARKWNPKMAPYIFVERNGIHIIDLHKTVVKVDEAAEVLKEMARSGRKVLFVATKKQAKDVVAEMAASVNMPSVTERWPGGMLTNFPTIRKAVKKMNTIDKKMAPSRSSPSVSVCRWSASGPNWRRTSVPSVTCPVSRAPSSWWTSRKRPMPSRRPSV